MPSSFSPRLDILPEGQRRLWTEFGTLPPEFTLYGGTAIALHLGHRESIDFDFFAHSAIDPQALYRALSFLQGATIIQSEPNTLTCLVDRNGDIKVSFFGLPHLKTVKEPRVSADNGVRIASLLDLAASKALVVQHRAQAKDYRDIDALIAAGIDLPQALAAARRAYGEAFTPTPTLKALTFFGDGDLPSLPAEMRKRLVRAATSVDPLRLPSLNRTDNPPRPRGGGRTR